MKAEDFSSSGNPIHAPELPDDFARGVIVKARALQRRRKVRGRIAAGMAVLLVAAAIPLANRIPSQSANLAARHSIALNDGIAWLVPIPNRAARHSPANDGIAFYQMHADQADTLRLAEATSPDAVGDYLLPNTTALTQFASAYSDTSWDYDPDWAVNSDASTGG